MPIQAVYESEY